MRAEDFFNHVRAEQFGEWDCWVWTKGKNSHGYGSVWFNGRSMGAHCVAWIITYGEIQSGLIVCHRCDNPSCCNPAHLFLGTHADNAADRDAKGRTKPVLVTPQIRASRRERMLALYRKQ